MANFKVTTKLKYKKDGSIKELESYWVFSKEELQNDVIGTYIKHLYEPLFEILEYKYELIDCFVSTSYILQEAKILDKYKEKKEIEFNFDQSTNNPELILLKEKVEGIFKIFNSLKNKKHIVKEMGLLQSDCVSELNSILIKYINHYQRAAAETLKFNIKKSINDLGPTGESLTIWFKLQEEEKKSKKEVEFVESLIKSTVYSFNILDK